MPTLRADDLATDMLGAIEARREYVPKALKALEAYDGAGVAVFIRDSNPHWLSERYGQPQADHSENVLRDYGIGAQILGDLGLTSIRILTNNPKKIRGLEGYGLSVTDQIPIESIPNPHNEAYLRTKADRMGHVLHHQGLAIDEEMIHGEQVEDERRREAEDDG